MYPQAKKIKVLKELEEEGPSIAKTAADNGVSCRTVRRWRDEPKEHTTDAALGRPRLLSKVEEEEIAEYVDEHPFRSVRDMRQDHDEIAALTLQRMSYRSACRYIQRMGYHRKVASCRDPHVDDPRHRTVSQTLYEKR